MPGEVHHRSAGAPPSGANARPRTCLDVLYELPAFLEHSHRVVLGCVALAVIAGDSTGDISAGLPQASPKHFCCNADVHRRIGQLCRGCTVEIGPDLAQTHFPETADGPWTPRRFDADNRQEQCRIDREVSLGQCNDSLYGGALHVISASDASGEGRIGPGRETFRGRTLSGSEGQCREDRQKSAPPGLLGLRDRIRTSLHSTPG